MKKALLHWLVIAIALFLAEAIIPGIDSEDWKGLVVAALVLGILNTFIRPILLLFSLPFILLTLGLFIILLNAGLLSLTAFLVEGFSVSGFWPAVGGAVVVSVVTFFFSLGKKKEDKKVEVRVKKRDARPANDDVIDI